MNRNIVWTLVAVGLYWLSVLALETEPTRNLVAGGGIAIALANVLRYLPKAWEKYRTGASAGEWRLLMGLELFWLGFGAREAWLLAVRLDNRPQWMVDSPLNGFFAYWILCAGLLCFSAASDPLPASPRQNVYVIVAVSLASALAGALLYRIVWG